MTAVLNSELISNRAAYTLGQAPPIPKPRLRLFVAAVDPTCEDSITDYEECTLAGYASVPLVPGNWSCSQAACVETCTYPLITFTFTAGGETIYGHFVTDDTSGGLMFSELWTTPFAVPSSGGSVQVTVQWVDQECP